MAEFVTRYKRYGQILAVFAKHDLGYAIDHLGLGKLFKSDKAQAAKASEAEAKETDEAEESEDSKGSEQAAEDQEALVKAESRALVEFTEEHLLTIPERLRMAFEELGPTFVKLGQIISTRPDLIPRSYIVEFRKLQDNVSELDFSEIKEVVESELGASIEERFASFDEEPLAAASIGQVHRCVLEDGTEAVVKVQRPGIEALIRMDLTILYGIARLANRSAISEVIDVVRIIQEFERVILRELDFTAEGRLTEEFAEAFDDDPQVHIAQIYWGYSSRRMLTMEFIKGINISDIERIREQGTDTEALAQQIAMITMRQVFIEGLFHADPHPGNLMVLPDGRLGILDFGMTGRFDKYTLSMLRDLMVDIVQKDHVSMSAHLLDHDIIDYETDMRKLKLDTRNLFRNLSSMPMAQASEALQGFIVEHKLRFPADLFFLDKTFGTLDGTVRLLSPSFSYKAVMKEFTGDYVARAQDLGQMAQELGIRLLKDADAIVDMPILMRRLLRRMDAGFFAIRDELHISDQAYARLQGLGLKMTGAATGMGCLIFSWITRSVGDVGLPWGIHLHSFLLTLGCLLVLWSAMSLWRGSKAS